MIEVGASQEEEALETEGEEHREEEEALEIEDEVLHEAEASQGVAGLHEVVALHQGDGVVTERCQIERASCAYARSLGIPTGDWEQSGCSTKIMAMSTVIC